MLLDCRTFAKSQAVFRRDPALPVPLSYISKLAGGSGRVSWDLGTQSTGFQIRVLFSGGFLIIEIPSVLIVQFFPH